MIGGDRGEVKAPHLAEPERLGDRDLAIAELDVGCQQLDLHGAADHRPQRDQHLEAGDATAGDQDLRTMLDRVEPWH